MAFELHDLCDDVDAVRAAYAPGAVVLDAPEFETLPPERAEELGLLVDRLSPASYPAGWLPEDAPEALVRYAGEEFTVGMPGDGGVAWTRQTEPPTVFVKERLTNVPAEFRAFLVAEALVQAGLELPEQFLPFFDGVYRDLAAAVPLGPNGTYQLATACHEAYLGLHTRPVFESWGGEESGDEDENGDGDGDENRFPRLHGAWRDAGERLRPRLAGLPEEVATGRTGFPAAAELACGAVRHGLDLPAPFGALDTAAYREYGAEYAVQWAETTFEALDADAGTDADEDT